MTTTRRAISTFRKALDAYITDIAGATSASTLTNRLWSIEILKCLDDIPLSDLDSDRCCELIEFVTSSIKSTRGSRLKSSSRSIIRSELLRFFRWLSESPRVTWEMPEHVKTLVGARVSRTRLGQTDVLQIGAWLSANKKACESMTPNQVVSAICDTLAIEATPESVISFCDEFGISLLPSRSNPPSVDLVAQLSAVTDGLIHLYEQLGEEPPKVLYTMMLDNSEQGGAA